MPTRTNHQLTIPASEPSVVPIAMPVRSLQFNGRSSDLVKVEQNTALHLAAMDAHDIKAEHFIEINTNIANKSADAFFDYARSSEARVNEARGMKLEKEIELVEKHFRQSLVDSYIVNLRDTARQTSGLAADSVLPRPEPEPKRGFWARVLDL